MSKEIYSRDVWESRVRAYRNSGIMQKQWCTENGVNVRTHQSSLCWSAEPSSGLVY